MYQKINNVLVRNWQLFSIIVLGLLLRLYKLTAISLWHDEAFSALLIQYSWGEMMHRIGLDVHPPMYYIFLRLWHYVFGNSLLSLRGMSVFFGVATIAAIYWLVNKTFDNKAAALTAALLVAVNPFQAQYVTEARMYTMGAFFAVLAAYSLIAALRNQSSVYGDSRRVGWQWQKSYVYPYVIFVVSCAIMILTHYYLLFTVAALGLYGLWYHIKTYGTSFRQYGWLLLSGLLILASFAPWLKIFLFQYKQVGAGYWIPPMNAWSIPRTLYEMAIKIGEPSHIVMILTTIAVLWTTVRVIKKYVEREKWLLISAFLAPFIGAILFYILALAQNKTSSVYLIRYFIFSSSFLVILISLAVQTFTIKYVRVMTISLLIGCNIFAIGYFWQQLDTPSKPGMSAAAAFINANVEPQHKIFVGSSFEFFNFKYYNRTSVKPLLFSGGQTDISSMPHYAGTAILTNEDLVPDFSKAVQTGDTVWVLWTNAFGGSQPSVPANWTRIDEKGYADTKPYVGTWIIVTEYKVN